MKFKRLLSGVLAAAMAISSISLSAFGEEPTSGSDINGTLTITAATLGETESTDVTISGAGEYTAKISGSNDFFEEQNIYELGFFTYSGTGDFTIDVTSVTLRDKTDNSEYTFTDIPHSTGLVPASEYTAPTSGSAENAAALPRRYQYDEGTRIAGDDSLYMESMTKNAISQAIGIAGTNAVLDGKYAWIDSIEYTFTVKAIGGEDPEPGNDINGTLTVTAAATISGPLEEATADVEINGAGDYTATVNFSTELADFYELGYFTYNGTGDFTIDVNSITVKDSTEEYTFVDILNSTGLVPTAEYGTSDNARLPNGDSTKYEDMQSISGVYAQTSALLVFSGAIIVTDESGGYVYPTTITYNFTVKAIGGEDPTEPVDYTALDEAITAGEAVNTSLYTDDSVKVLTDAIAAAKAVKENAEATQADVDAAAKTITDAIAGLAEKTSKENVEIVLTDEAKCYNEGNAFKYALDGTWAAHHIVSADSLAYIKSGNAAMNKITAAVEVSGTVSEEFSLYLCFAGGDYAYWGEGNSANKAMSADVLNVTKPGIYYISMAFDTAANPTALNYIGIQGSSNSYKNNPDAAVTIKEIYINDTTEFTGVAYDSLGYSIIKGYSGPFKIVAIPETFEGLPVQTINNGAFDKNSDIKSVYIPDCVTKVAGYAFRDCTNLESVRLPEGLKTVSSSLFQGCTSLKTVEIPESVTTVGAYAFMDSGITSIVIPDSVTSIGNYLFDGAADLKDVTLPSGITTIPSGTFSGSGLETYTVPDSVTSIAQNAFEGCEKLESVTIPNADIEAWAFHNCTSLTSVTLPEGKKIGIQAFMGCTNLTNVTIPENADLWTDTFTDTGLKEVTLPVSVGMGSRSFGYTSDGAKVDGFIIRMNLESITESNDPKTALTSSCEGYNYATNNGFTLVDEYQNKLLAQDITDAEAITNDDNKYTAASFDSLQKAIAAAKNLTDDSDRKVVIESRNQIAEAIAALTEAPSDPSADVYTWTGEWVRSKGMADAGTANGITVESTGGGWQMLIKDLDISNMVQPVLVAECTANKIQVWKGQGTSGAKISTGAESGSIIDLTQYNDATVLTLSLTNTGSITSVKIYDAAYVVPIDYTALDTAISNGQAVDKTKYTADSVKELTDAITNAQNIKKNGDATQADVDAAAKAITDAIDKLVEKDLLTVYIQSNKHLKSTSVDFNGKGDYSATITLDNNYWYGNLGGFALSPYPTDGPDFEIDVNSIVIKSAASTYTLIPTIGNKGIVPSADTTRTDLNGLPYTFTKNEVYAQSEDGQITLTAYDNSTMRLLVNGVMTKISTITYNFTVRDPLTESVDTTALEAAITAGKNFDSSKYTESTYTVLTSAIENGDKVLANPLATQVDVDAAAKEIEDAIVGLAYKPADYSAVEAAKAKVPADLSAYTYETAKAVTDAVAAVVEGKDITEQSDVDAWAKAIEDAIAGLELKPTGGNVSGTIKVSDADDSTEMTVVAVSADGIKTSVAATSMGTYKLENLAAGDYTLTISGGKYAPRSYEITVTEGDISQDVELNPYGDINGDGKVTTADVGMANSHAKGVSILEDYKFVCADVNIDGSITTADVGMINSHAKGVKELW